MALSPYRTFLYSDLALVAKHGYAILDSQNVYIKMTIPNKIAKLSNDPFIFLLWRVYMKK